MKKISERTEADILMAVLGILFGIAVILVL